MLFMVRFEDHPDKLNIRERFLDAHIKWLDEQSGSVLIGGSLRHEPGDQPVGGLWVVRADSKQAVEAMIETDPFWINGLRQGKEILHWSKAFEDRMVAI